MYNFLVPEVNKVKVLCTPLAAPTGRMTDAKTGDKDIRDGLSCAMYI